MSSKIKLIVKRFLLYSRLRYRYYSRTKAFKQRYKNIDSSLFNKSLSEKVLNEYREKWGVFGFPVEINTFLLCYNLSGRIDFNIVPENIFAAIIEPSINNYKDKELLFVSVKNIYEKWFDKKNVFPKSILHKIDNVYYDKDYQILENVNNFLSMTELQYPLVFKPSLGTAGGSGVRIINDLSELKSSLELYENFVCQEMIVQNSSVDKFTPGSISSVRTCLYRTTNGNFKVLNNSIRFGVDGGLDNETAGGLVCNIQGNGFLNNYAVNKYCEKYYEHPNSRVRFSDFKIPFYDEIFEVAEAIANEIPLCNLVSLDMCLDADNEWRCIEINLRGQTIRFAQYAGFGFFGEYTSEVLHRVLNKK